MKYKLLYGTFLQLVIVTVMVSPAHADADAGAVTSHNNVSGREFPFELEEAFGNVLTAHGIGLVYCARTLPATSAVASSAARTHVRKPRRKFFKGAACVVLRITTVVSHSIHKYADAKTHA